MYNKEWLNNKIISVLSALNIGRKMKKIAGYKHIKKVKILQNKPQAHYLH